MIGGMLVKGSATTINSVGKTIWSSPIQRVCITSADLYNEKVLYEIETGNCCLCQGSGEEIYGYSINVGTKKRPCPKCNATGKGG
jgi:hypothetical protein